MDTRELEERILDATVSDEDILAEVREVTRDKFDEQGNLIPPTIEEIHKLAYLARLLRAHRRAVDLALLEDLARMFDACCGKGVDHRK